MNKPLRILIADDHAGIRRSLRALLESRPGWRVCGEATNGREAIDQTRRLDPDIIVMDVSMPELDGLKATREIVRADPGARVLVLTMHESAELTAEAARAGAKGVVGKSDPPHALLAMVETLAGAELGAVRHVAAFFHSDGERYDVLARFIAAGLERGEKVVHIVDPPARKSHAEALLPRGVDLDRAETEGKARLIGSHELYLRDGRFDRRVTTSVLTSLLGEGANGGFRRTQLIAHMDWVLAVPSGVEELVEYESRLGQILPRYADTLICAYDLTKFSAATILDVLRAHPAVLIAGRLRQNPFYAPTDQLMPELRARATA